MRFFTPFEQSIPPLVLMIIACLSGCVDSNVKSSPAPIPPTSQPVVVSIPIPIVYSHWKQLTEKPKVISLSEFTTCLVFGEEKARLEGLGPHWEPMVKVFANQLAEESINTRQEKALPAGSIIIKEKWLTKRVPNQFEYVLDDQGPGAYAAMIKREAGYDPDFGDWEYVYVTLHDVNKVERGRLETCRGCHSKANQTDFLFLPDPASDLYSDPVK